MNLVVQFQSYIFTSALRQLSRLMNCIFEYKFSIHRRSISILKTSTTYKTAILCELNVFENILAVFFPVQLLNFK